LVKNVKIERFQLTFYRQKPVTNREIIHNKLGAIIVSLRARQASGQNVLQYIRIQRKNVSDPHDNYSVPGSLKEANGGS